MFGEVGETVYFCFQYKLKLGVSFIIYDLAETLFEEKSLSVSGISPTLYIAASPVFVLDRHRSMSQNLAAIYTHC